MENRHVVRERFGQGFISRRGKGTDFVGIDSRHEECWNIDLFGKARRDIGMERHFRLHDFDIFGRRLDIVKHQGDARCTGRGKRPGLC